MHPLQVTWFLLQSIRSLRLLHNILLIQFFHVIAPLAIYVNSALNIFETYSELLTLKSVSCHFYEKERSNIARLPFLFFNPSFARMFSL